MHLCFVCPQYVWFYASFCHQTTVAVFTVNMGLQAELQLFHSTGVSTETL
jgi:hypothetical protein